MSRRKLVARHDDLEAANGIVNFDEAMSGLATLNPAPCHRI